MQYIHSTTFRVNIDPNLSLISDLSYLLYLEYHEPFSFALAKIRLRKAYSVTVSEFTSLYKGYKAMRGTV